MSAEILTAIALLCGSQHQSGSSPSRVLDCQQKYIRCISNRFKNKKEVVLLTTDEALTQCVLDKK